MKKVLILGAGLVTKPAVHYLLEKGFEVTVASRTLSKAEILVKGFENGKAKQLDIKANPEGLAEEVANTDLAISLLPAPQHPVVAKECIKNKIPLVTTSYVSPAMQELDEEAKAAGVILLNECGLDPGIDHMTAMQVIHQVEKEGGKVTDFSSYCGGLPSVRHNNNPFGYKFSWSPRGVVTAGKNAARFTKNGKEVNIPGEELFDNYEFVTIPNLGVFEGYPNRDSLVYLDRYNLSDMNTMFRGTLRNIGHCETWRYMVKLGLFDDEKKYDLKDLSPIQLLMQLVNAESEDKLEEALKNTLGLSKCAVIIKKLKWLGFFNKEKLPIENGSAMDVLVYQLEKNLQYNPGELDLIVLQHEFIAKYPDRQEKIISTLIDEGIPEGDSAMARTVSLPAAIATRMILEGKMEVKGVRVPVIPEIYEPILKELQELKITFNEHKEKI